MLFEVQEIRGQPAALHQWRDEILRTINTLYGFMIVQHGSRCHAATLPRIFLKVFLYVVVHLRVFWSEPRSLCFFR